jgi:hypothetical protein
MIPVDPATRRRSAARNDHRQKRLRAFHNLAIIRANNIARRVGVSIAHESELVSPSCSGAVVLDCLPSRAQKQMSRSIGVNF